MNFAWYHYRQADELNQSHWGHVLSAWILNIINWLERSGSLVFFSTEKRIWLLSWFTFFFNKSKTAQKRCNRNLNIRMQLNVMYLQSCRKLERQVNQRTNFDIFRCERLVTSFKSQWRNISQISNQFRKFKFSLYHPKNPII